MLLEKTITRFEDKLALKASTMQVNPNFEFQPEQVAKRAFKIRNLDYKGRNITLVSIESNMQFLANGRTDFVPANWREQIGSAMDGASLAFVEYFPEELRRKAYQERISGKFFEEWGERNIEPVYEPVAQMAKDRGIPIAVSDMGNSRAYLLYNRNPVEQFANKYMFSARDVHPTNSERYVPQVVTARRFFATIGLMNTVEQYPQDSSFLYVAAPAHANRIERFLHEPPKLTDKAMRLFYENTFYGVDHATRIYDFNTQSGDWVARPPENIYTPGKQLKPVLLTAGVAAGVGMAARHMRRRS